LDPPEV
jgi:hypothetical protein